MYPISIVLHNCLNEWFSITPLGFTILVHIFKVQNLGFLRFQEGEYIYVNEKQREVNTIFVILRNFQSLNLMTDQVESS